MPGTHDAGTRLLNLASRLRVVAADLAVFLVYDRPERVADRPGIDRAHFAERCVSDEQLSQTLEAIREVGGYAEIIGGDQEFLEAVGTGRLLDFRQRVKLVYNGIEGGIAHDGFSPGRKALVPVVADAVGLSCANSNAHACALGRHKFQYFEILRSLGVRVPATWHYRPGEGWAGGRSPRSGQHVIAKSTYESWSVGVLQDAAIVVGDDFEQQVAHVAEVIGQAVCVQEFVVGREICCPVYDDGELFCSPPMLVTLAKAPNDPRSIMTFEDNVRQAGVVYSALGEADPLRDTLAEISIESFRALELTAFARIDVRVDAAGDPWVIDVGVSPGVSRQGSSFASAASVGLSHADFIRAVLGASLPSVSD